MENIYLQCLVPQRSCETISKDWRKGENNTGRLLSTSKAEFLLLKCPNSYRKKIKKLSTQVQGRFYLIFKILAMNEFFLPEQLNELFTRGFCLVLFVRTEGNRKLNKIYITLLGESVGITHLIHLGESQFAL